LKISSCCGGFAPGEAHSPFRNSTRSSVDSVAVWVPLVPSSLLRMKASGSPALTSPNVANAWLGKPTTKLSSRATQRDLMGRVLKTSVRDEAALKFNQVPNMGLGVCLSFCPGCPLVHLLRAEICWVHCVATGRLQYLTDKILKYCAVGIQRATRT
jgi:hypothetical protein